ncbi:MAG: bifunctional 5,10-methylenetetrahydrofolate dehydrogenase/5,10-methenyltetrahydrofolate cyclohydrolase [Brevinema sp.]
MNNSFLLLNGKVLSEEYNKILKKKIDTLSFKLCLATVLVGDDSASKIYVQSKIRACEKVGVLPHPIYLPETCTEEELITEIEKLNQNDKIHGILVQLPLPKHIDTAHILLKVAPSKDVDAFHPHHVGNLMTGVSDFAPATPTGIMQLLDLLGESWSLEGKKALVIGASNIVGKPTAALLLQKNATVTIAHKYTKNLKELCLNSDLIVSAVGKAHLITKDMVSEGTVLIDVGMNKVWDETIQKERLVGDMDFDDLKDQALAITPVPGGVGPMTISALLQNLYTLATETSHYVPKN